MLNEVKYVYIYTGWAKSSDSTLRIFHSTTITARDMKLGRAWGSIPTDNQKKFHSNQSPPWLANACNLFLSLWQRHVCDSWAISFILEVMCALEPPDCDDMLHWPSLITLPEREKSSSPFRFFLRTRKFPPPAKSCVQICPPRVLGGRASLRASRTFTYSTLSTDVFSPWIGSFDSELNSLHCMVHQ